MRSNFTDPQVPWDECAQRILIFTESYLSFDGTYSPGGRQRYIRDLARLIKDWGRDVLIIQKGVHAFDTTCPDGISVLGIRSNLSARGDLSFSREALRIATHGDVWLYASGENAWPYFTANSKAIQHGVWWDGPQRLLTRLIQRQRVLGMLRGVRSVLCVDTNFINWLRGQGPIGYQLTTKCTYVPNYVDIDRVSPTRRTVNEPLSLIIARRFERKRGTMVFIEALARLRQMEVPFRAQVCTIGGKREILDRICIHGLQDLVTTTEETMDSVLDEYQNHHIAVVPTLWSEGTSLACIEAISAGVPVVASPVGGLGNLVFPGFNGLITNPEPHGIASAISELWCGGLWERMHQNCLSMREAFSIRQWHRQVLPWLKT